MSNIKKINPKKIARERSEINPNKLETALERRLAPRETQSKVNTNKNAERANLDLTDRLVSDLEDKGFIQLMPESLGGSLNIDTDYVSLPRDLTETPSRLLGQYLNALTQQKAYTRTLSSWQSIDTEDHKRAYHESYSLVYTELTRDNPKMSEKAKELMSNNDPSVYPYYLKYRDNQMKLKMVEDTLESLNECIFLVSREISRRTLDSTEIDRYDKLK